MPYKSKAQAAYFHIHKKELERQGVDVDEWDKASKGKKLPKHVKGSNKKANQMNKYANIYFRQLSEKLATNLAIPGIDSGIYDRPSQQAFEGVRPGIVNQDPQPQQPLTPMPTLSPTTQGLMDQYNQEQNDQAVYEGAQNLGLQNAAGLKPQGLAPMNLTLGGIVPSQPSQQPIDWNNPSILSGL